MKVFKGFLIFLMSAGLLANGISWAQDEGLPDGSGDIQINQDHQEATDTPQENTQENAPSPSSDEPVAESVAPQESQPLPDTSDTPAPSEVPQQTEPTAQEATPAVEKPAAPTQEQPAQESKVAESPATPAQPQEQQPEVPMPPDELMGLDTVDLEDPQGNWLFKRVWWERAEQKYEKIRSVVTQIMEQRSGFFTKRSDLDKNVLDPFYIGIGFKLGELLQKINDSIESLKSQTELQPADTKNFEALQENKKELENLRSDVEKVVKQDEAVDKALLQFVDQINKLRHYEQQAWQDFKDIARVLDDKKARELFYKIDNAWQNIQKVQEYVEQTFTSSFEALVADVSKQIERIKSNVAELKERGIILHITKQVGDQEEEEDQKEQGFFGSIFETITRTIRDVVNAVIAVIRWPYDFIFGGKKPAETESDVEQPTMPTPDELEKSVEAEAAQDTQEAVQEDTLESMQKPLLKKPGVPVPGTNGAPSNDAEVEPHAQEPQEEVVEMQELDIVPESNETQEGDQEPESEATYEQIDMESSPKQEPVEDSGFDM